MGSLDHATADHVVTSETLTNGLYFITTQDPDTKQFQRTEVWCDFEAAIPKTFKLVLNADTAVDIKTASPDDVASARRSAWYSTSRPGTKMINVMGMRVPSPLS